MVIDASSLAKYILRERNWKSVRNYLLEESFSLNLALAEVSNAIWKHIVLYDKILREQADKMFKALEKLTEVVIFESFEKYLDNSVKIALNSGITVYDALYMAQAEKIGKTSHERRKAEKSCGEIRY